MANELPEGTRRVGALVDFDPNTPEVTVTLEHSDRGIGVTVPWNGPDSPYAGWFMPNGALGGSEASDADRPRAPRRLLFSDSHGSLMLVGCWARGFHAAMFGPGNGHVWAKAAVIGVDSDIDFDAPHGVQTEISGLREWLGISSWGESHSWGENGAEVTIKSVRREAIELGEAAGLALDLRPGYLARHEDARDRIVLTDYVRCATVGSSPRRWSEHLSVHHAIRDLLMLSRWRRESCDVVKAMRDDDPLLTLDGKEHGRQWRTVVEPSSEPLKPVGSNRQHLIQYADIGPAGVGKWLVLRDDFARSLDPVITSVWLKNERPLTVLAHTGPGLEALGYQLMVRDGMKPKTAADASLRERLDRIVKDVGACLPFDGAVWAGSFVKAYNGLKHANRTAPDDVDVMNVWREGVLAVRAWVALELGIDASVVADRLKGDPQQYPYVAAE